MANSVDPDQTAPILFSSILNLSVMLGNYLQQTTSADDFFLGALRHNNKIELSQTKCTCSTLSWFIMGADGAYPDPVCCG